MSQQYPQSDQPGSPPATQYPNAQPPMYPQQPMMPPAAPKKSGAWKKVLIILGVVLVLCIAACAIISNAFNSAVNQTTTGTISSGNTSSGNTSTQANPPAKIGNPGDTITVNDVSCTLTSVKKLAADAYISPKAGNQLCTLTN